MRNQRGMTLIEILIAMTVFLIVLGGVVKAIGSQSQGFRKGSDELGILQNLRYGVDQVEQDLRLAGANVTTRQPIVDYAGTSAFAFNADIISNIAGDISAVYIDVDAGNGEVQAWPLAGATQVPGSSPSFTYPMADYLNSMAETVMFWFTADTSTTRNDDYVLMRRVNVRPEETLMRNILLPTSGNFFRYYYNNTPVGGGNPTLDTVPTAWYPLSHSAALHGSLPDTGILARIDLVRAAELRYRVTNGRTGTDERIRAASALLVMPNSGVKKLSTCGDTPIFGQVLTAAYNATPPGSIELTWNRSVDETAGESDVIRYVVWRRVGGVGPWGDPYKSLAVMPAGPATYTDQDTQITSGTSYQYAVASQDCTPALSTQSISNTIAVP